MADLLIYFLMKIPMNVYDTAHECKLSVEYYQGRLRGYRAKVRRWVRG